jgi:lambda family phage portal protein
MSKQPRRSVLAWVGQQIDSVLKAVHPEAAARRLEARAAVTAAETVMTYYSGASKDRMESGRWLASGISPDGAIEEDRVDLLKRAEELYRDDSIGGLIDHDLEHVIGTGFTIQAKAKVMAGITEEAAKQFNEEIEFLWDVWSKHVDVTGRQSLWRQSRLAWRTLRYAGETVTILSDTSGDESPVPLTIEVIDPQRLETPPEEAGNVLVRQGVKFDRSGRIVGYYIRKAHPEDPKDTRVGYDELPPERVIHLFDPHFCAQTRGVTWFARVLRDIRDAKDLQAALLMAAQVEACFAGFRKRKHGSPTLNSTLAATGTENGRRIEDIRPGTITDIGADDEIQFSTPTKGNAVGTLQELAYRRIAAGLNVPYAFLTGDWQGVSHAGGRLILHGAKMTTQSAQKMFAEGWIDPIWRAFCDECVMLGKVTLSPREYLRQPYAWRNHKTTAQAWGYAVNPKEEVQADIMAIEGHLKTHEQAIGERGGDFEDVIAQREREVQQIDDAGLQQVASTRGGGSPADEAAKSDEGKGEGAKTDPETPESDQ